MTQPSFPERAALVRRATVRLCVRLGWAPLHEVPLPNGRRADILRDATPHPLAPARRTALLRQFATLAAGRLAALEDPLGMADLRSALRAE